MSSDTGCPCSARVLPSKPVLKEWYTVEKKDMTEGVLGIHRNNLTIRCFGGNYITGEESAPSIVYQETSTHFSCPFYYGLSAFGTDVVDERNTGQIDKTRTLQFHGDPSFGDTMGLDPAFKQPQACESVLRSLNSIQGAALLALPPGTGKTVCACFVWTEICKLHGGVVPALILVHKTFLADQWRERIARFVPEAKIGTLQADVVDYKHKDIVICTIQSLINKAPSQLVATEQHDNPGTLNSTDDDHLSSESSEEAQQDISRRYPPQVMQRFGLLIIDEAHHISAKKFQRSFPWTGMRRVLLLTGTPYRRDRSEKVAEAWVGPVTFQTDRAYHSRVQVWSYKPEYEHLPEKLNVKQKPDYNLMIKGLAECDARNKQVAHIIIQLYDTGRQILVLSDRCNRLPHLDILQSILKDRRPDIVTSIFVGHTKRKDRQAAMNARVILSTYQMAAEALDIPTLSGLVFATPKPGVGCPLFEQAVYRVIRGRVQVLEPVIVEFVDDHYMWYAYAASRTKFYNKENSKNDVAVFVVKRFMLHLDAMLGEYCQTELRTEEDIGGGNGTCKAKRKRKQSSSDEITTIDRVRSSTFWQPHVSHCLDSSQVLVTGEDPFQRRKRTACSQAAGYSVDISPGPSLSGTSKPVLAEHDLFLL